MKALLMAFSMYSRLPVPDFVWEEEDRKKAMCFFSPGWGPGRGRIFPGISFYGTVGGRACF